MSDALNAYITVHFGSAQAIKEAEKTQSKFESVSNKIKKAFSFGGLGAGLFAGFSMKTAYEDTLKLAQVSEKLNFDVDQLSKFNNLMTQFGGNTDDTTDAMLTINNAIRQFRLEGNGALKELSARIQGFNPFNAEGGIKNEIELMEELRRTLRGLDEDQQIEALEKAGLGNNTAILRYVRATDKEYAEMVNNANKMAVITEKQKENTLRMQRTMAQIKQSFIGVGASFLEAAEPALNVVNDLLQKFNGLDDTTKKIIGSAFMLAPALSPALKTAGGLVKFFGDFNSVISISKAGIGGMTKMLGIASFQMLTIAGTIYGSYKIAKWFADKWGDKKAEETAQYLNSDEYDKNEGLQFLKASKTYQNATDEEKKDMEERFLISQKNGRGERFQPQSQENQIPDMREYQTTPVNNINNNTDNSNNSRNATTSNEYHIVINGVENPQDFKNQIESIMFNNANIVR